MTRPVFLWLLHYAMAFVPVSRRPCVSPGTVLNLFDDSIDVSDGQGTVLKRILRQGDWRAGRPVEEASVEIKWELRFLNGSVIGSSKPYEDVNDEPFTVRMGAQPRDMIEGWELALASMYPGEVSSVYLSSAVAFGEKGLADLVPPHTNIECTLELCSILPALTKRFKTVGEDESISQELVEKIQTGEIPRPQEIEVVTQEFVTSSAQQPGSPDSTSTNPKLKPKAKPKDSDSVKFFDDKVHKLDPNQRVSGVSRGHVWEETMNEMDVEVELPDGTLKADLVVGIAVGSLSVKLRSGQVLLEGPLHGKVLPSDCHWAILDVDPLARLRGRRLQLSLKKSHGSRDIWATVLDRGSFVQTEQSQPRSE